jgi:peptidoglycan/LPS O-acetylase OafA/YrhL
MRYRPEVDGLRAVAVIPVILFHAGFDTFSGGFVGVDVFFVISGYLITSIIVAEMEAGNFSLANFYERRARRILPALFLVMAVCIPFAWAWLLPKDLKDFAQSLVAVSTFSSNFLFWIESGYFHAAAELKPLLHTWSLAVEEQYYVLFPLFIMIFWKSGKCLIISILGVLALLSLAAAHWGAIYLPTPTFYLLPTRGWELLVGVFVAFYMAGKEETKGRQIPSLLGFLMIAYAIFAFDEQTPFPSLYALVPTVGVALVLLFTFPGTLVHKILCNKAIVGIGLISYSAYLWHQPLIAFSRNQFSVPDGNLVMFSLMLASLGLAYISYRFVEKPFRSRGGTVTLSRNFVVASLSSCAILFIALGVAGHFRDGFKDYYLENRLTKSEASVLRLVNKHTGGDIYERMVDDGKCSFWSRSVTPQFVERFHACSRRHGPAVVVLGDSHAQNVFNIVAKANVQPFVVGIAQGGCRPNDEPERCHYEGFAKFLEGHPREIELVLYQQSGAYFIEDRNGKVDSPLAFEAEEKYSFRDSNIKMAVDYVSELNTTVKTVWVGPFTEARIDFHDDRTIFRNLKVNKNSIHIFSELEDHIAKVTEKNRIKSGLQYVSLVNHMKIDEDFMRIGDCITYFDQDHFSSCGEQILSQTLKPVLTKLIEENKTN